MSSFLEHVAEDLLKRFGENLSRVAVVFPNKRASLFLNDYLARKAGKPIWSPAYITISELFRSHSQRQVADPILLVCLLHQCFTECTGFDETLDHFYGWGQLLLSDFDDLDKNMGPADKVFANLRDIHELDDVSYLTEEQREMIQRFFSNFSTDHNSELKERFLRLWSKMGMIYHQFNAQLAEQNLAYEGALYREVATNENLDFLYDHYVFIGFNLLQQVEQVLFARLEQIGKAVFYQDTEEVTPQKVSFVSAPTENIQARYISQWLDHERINDGRRTAIVLCNEGLLQAVIHCLPESVDKVNVTTGYPLLQTSVASLVSQLVNLQINGYSTKTNAFRKRWLDHVARHPYAPYLPEDYAATHYTENGPLLRWLLVIVRTLGTTLSKNDDALQAESIFRIYTLLNRLSDLIDNGVLKVDKITLQRLLAQLIQATSIPFHGEPAEGIQIMGVLETRNLDFDHVLLLSCNEGNMPKGVNDTSFIPYAIRKAYGLTTVDHKVAVYEHYFHRLLQRAKDVTIVYNNSTNDGQTGEMSRFMLQLMASGKQPISYYTLKAGQQPILRTPEPIAKTPAVMAILKERFSKAQGGISPTALATYLRCQLRFYYRYVSNLIEPDDTDEELIDNRVFGNIFHKAAEIIYTQLKALTGNNITRSAIDKMLESGVEIERAVDEAFRSEYGHPIIDGLQLINREVIIKYVHLLLETDRQYTPFSNILLEKKVSMPWGDTIIGGIVDRLDRDDNGIRVIDYKTGTRLQKKLPDVEAIFDPRNVSGHSDYYLQAFIYSHIVRLQNDCPVSPQLLFIQHAGANDYNPTLTLGNKPVTDIAEVSEQFIERLKQLLDDIMHPDISFQPTDDADRCRSCPYAKLCR